MDTTIIIPARYGSRRFPGKPMAKILGKPMIEWVWRAAMATKDRSRRVKSVIVATDSEEILECCREFGADAELTDLRHPNGTSRCLEVCESRGWSGEIDRQVLILQGDEPMMQPEFLIRMARAGVRYSIVSGYCKLEPEELGDENVVKVLVGKHGHSIYFSRQPLKGAHRHLGVYLYRMSVLRTMVRSSPGPLERLENLEQLRVVEGGGVFHMVKWDGANYTEPVSVDVPEDVAKIEELMRPARTR